MRDRLLPREPKPTPLRPSRLLYTAALLLVAIGIAIVRFNSGSITWSKVVIAVAVLLLVARLLSRRVKRNIDRAAQPDPESRLRLD